MKTSGEVSNTLFENHPKMSHLNFSILAFFTNFGPIFVLVTLFWLEAFVFQFWHLPFFTNFCPIEIDLSGNTVLPQTSVFLKVAKLVIFIQYVSVAHFARSVVK